MKNEVNINILPNSKKGIIPTVNPAAEWIRYLVTEKALISQEVTDWADKKKRSYSLAIYSRKNRWSSDKTMYRSNSYVKLNPCKNEDCDHFKPTIDKESYCAYCIYTNKFPSVKTPKHKCPEQIARTKQNRRESDRKGYIKKRKRNDLMRTQNYSKILKPNSL